MQIRKRVVVLALLLSAGRAYAAQLGDADDLLSLEVHGFASQGFLYSLRNNYLAHTTRGSFEFTEIGINFTKQLTDTLRFGVQMFSRDLGPLGNYSIKADWFYADYRVRDWLGVRVGRVKLPFGLYNDTSDIDAARVPVLLPQSVYPTRNRDFLLAQTGGEIYGYLRLGGAGALDYRAFAGTIFLPVNNTAQSAYDVAKLEIPYVVGGRLLWETPVEGLRVGGSVMAARLESKLLPAGSNDTFQLDISSMLWVVSAELARGDLLVSAEYSRWHNTTTTSGAPAALPSGTTVSERMYAMLSYRLRPWFHPCIYFSLLFPDVAHRAPSRAQRQQDLSLTIRVDINRYFLLKLEGHYMHGTADVDPALNGGTPRSELARDWAVFMAKTTAYF